MMKGDAKEAKEATEEVPEVKKVPKAKEVQPSLSQKPTDALGTAAIPSAADTQPNDPPNPFLV